MADTEIVYLISPDWGHYLLASLTTLFNSGSTFDTVRVYCVGEPPADWRFTDPRVVVERVEPLDPRYFLINKTRFTGSRGGRAIFLDADTLVLRPLDEVFRGVDADFIARPASAYHGRQWNRRAWEELFAKLDAPPVPYFNAGFFVFQNGSHRRIGGVWPDYVRRGMERELFDPTTFHDPRNVEQIALSLAVGSARLSYAEMGARAHAYGWNAEPHADAVVFHTGNPPFLKVAKEICRERGIDLLGQRIADPASGMYLRMRGVLTG